MTLQQLRYVTAIAETGTLSEAARRFYIAQPSLTASLRELEEELGLTIFRRTNRGAVLTPEGEEFLGYARQVLAQMDLMEEKYLGAAPVKHQFCVSTQHYSFAVEAFVELLREYGGPEYDFRIRETQTYELIEDVALLRSEVGVLYLNKDNETVLRKVIREHDLQFTPLFTAKPHVFVSASSPLAAKPAVTLDDLAPYPRLSYEQGEHNAFYFSEEILSTRDSKKDILVSDRDLVTLLKQAERQQMMPGREFGIISYNDTPLKEILAGGITTLSTDFRQMGLTLAQLISQKGIRNIENPWMLNIRRSL